MAPIVYLDPMSAPAQAVDLTLRKLGLDSVVEAKRISLVSGEHLKPEYLKKFPMHSVPSVEDDGFYLWDSNAIMPYLVSKFGKDDTLYPKDNKKRAKVDQWLHFANSILYIRLREMVLPLWQRQRKDIPAEKKQSASDGLKMLEEMLGNNKFLCGDALTLADIACVCEYYGLSAVIDVSGFKSLAAWAKRCQDNLPGFESVVIAVSITYKAALMQIMSS